MLVLLPAAPLISGARVAPVAPKLKLAQAMSRPVGPPVTDGERERVCAAVQTSHVCVVACRLAVRLAGWPRAPPALAAPPHSPSVPRVAPPAPSRTAPMRSSRQCAALLTRPIDPLVLRLARRRSRRSDHSRATERPSRSAGPMSAPIDAPRLTPPRGANRRLTWTWPTLALASCTAQAASSNGAAVLQKC